MSINNSTKEHQGLFLNARQLFLILLFITNPWDKKLLVSGIIKIYKNTSSMLILLVGSIGPIRTCTRNDVDYKYKKTPYCQTTFFHVKLHFAILYLLSNNF